MGLATPERLAQTRAIWHDMVQAAAADGYLLTDHPVELVLQSMAHITGGALLSWAMGSQSTQHLAPSVGLGYALCLNGAATPKGRSVVAPHIETYQAALSDFAAGEFLRTSETL